LISPSFSVAAPASPFAVAPSVEVPVDGPAPEAPAVPISPASPLSQPLPASPPSSSFPDHPLSSSSLSSASTSTAGSPIDKLKHCTDLPNDTPIGPAAHFHRFQISVWGLCGTTQTLIAPAFSAGYSQVFTSHTGFDSDASGYGYHYGVNLTSNVTSKFFSKFAIPTLFREDEAYVPLQGDGCFKSRVWHAMKHTWKTRSEDHQREMANFSYLLTPLLTESLSTVYQPPAQRTFGHTFERAGYDYLGNFAVDLFYEFQPDLFKPSQWRCHRSPAPSK
jgi:hypothetical protein